MKSLKVLKIHVNKTDSLCKNLYSISLFILGTFMNKGSTKVLFIYAYPIFENLFNFKHAFVFTCEWMIFNSLHVGCKMNLLH
jgi:hypothetical protein